MAKKLMFLFLFLITTQTAWSQGDAEKSYLNGVNEYSNGYFHKAIPHFIRVLKHKPGHHDAAYRLAICYSKTRNYGEAIKIFKVLTNKRMKNYPNLYFEIGKLYFEIQDHKNAAAYFKRSKTKGYKPYASDYFRGYMAYLDEDYKKAEKIFNYLKKKDRNKDIQQSASFYLGNIYFKREEKNFVKNRFKASRAQYEKTRDMDEDSKSGKLANNKLYEIDRRLGLKPKQRKFSGSLIQSVELDTNPLSENDNTVNKTDTESIKINTILDAKYRALQGNKFFFHPQTNLNFSYYYATEDNKQSNLSSVHSFIATQYFNMGTNGLWGSTPVELFYPMRVNMTVNQQANPPTWQWYSIVFGWAPSMKWKPWAPNYTSVGADFYYTLNATQALSTFTAKLTANQTYQILEKLGSSFTYYISYIALNNDKLANNLAISFNYKWIHGITLLWGISETLTWWRVDSTRNVDSALNVNATIQRSFLGLISFALQYNFDWTNSKNNQGDFTKHRIGLKGTISF